MNESHVADRNRGVIHLIVAVYDAQFLQTERERRHPVENTEHTLAVSENFWFTGERLANQT